MAQNAKVIDLTRSYVPGDPNAFPQNLGFTQSEDRPEQEPPILAYEGYNFLPTSYGYRSYFGRNETLDVGALGSRVQFILSYQLPNFQSRLIALCETGIWTLNPHVTNSAWTQAVTFNLDTPAPFYQTDTFEEWTYCLIENVLYMYQQGRSSAWKTAIVTNELAIQTHTPSFLNMAGQMGIFKAGTRLGFWDSANSTSWSSNLDLTDFTPSVENMAGNAIFADEIGRIISVKSHGEGWIIYTTKSVVGVTLDITGNLLWDAKKIFDNIGITNARNVTFGQSDNEHIAYTTNGMYMIGKFNALNGTHQITPLAPEVYDFLKESRDPIYLDTINSRHLFVGILNPDYVYGITSFDYVKPEDLKVRFTLGGRNWDGITLPAITLNCRQAATTLKQLVTFGFESTSDTVAMWNIVATAMQDNTNGPFDVGSRDAQTPGFVKADIENTYMPLGTLPTETQPNEIEVGDFSMEFLGYTPYENPTITDAMSSTTIQMMYKQLHDWELWRQHQNASKAIIESAAKVTTTPGVTAYYNGSATVAPTLPALPATTVVDSVVGDIPTGEGNIEIQLDRPLKKIVMRKYWQRKHSIVKRVTTSYAWRVGSGVAGKSWDISGASLVFNHSLSGAYDQGLTVPASNKFYGLTSADCETAAKAKGEAYYYPATVTIPSVGTFNRGSFNGNSISCDYAPSHFYGLYSIPSFLNTTIYPWYQDKVETITYIITTSTADMGYTDFKATQSSYAHTVIQVTSDPKTIVVHSPTPIFPTGASAINFFPPAWSGTPTLKLIAASAYSPWHLIDGTFGIEASGLAAIAGAEGYPVGETCAVGSPENIATDYGTTYSSFPYLLQIGGKDPLYPLMSGALVLDLALKKWGKAKMFYNVLIDLQPVNQYTPMIITEDDKGMTAAIMDYTGTIQVLDDAPSESLIRYGKAGYYRLGMTNVLEVLAHNRDKRTGTLTVDASMDGLSIDTTLSYSLNFTGTKHIAAYPDISARWHTVSFTGNYDLTGLEIRGKIAGRR